jgi:transglutaminase superfamily protein
VNRRILSLCPVLTFAVLCGIGCAADPVKELAREMEATKGTAWYGAYFGGRQKCGYARIELDTRTVNGTKFYVQSMMMDVNFQMGAVRQKLKTEQTRYYKLTGELARLESTSNSLLGDTKHEAVVDGKKLIVTTTMGGHSMKNELPVPNETLMQTLAASRLIRKGTIGGTVEFEVFEPTISKTMHVTTKLLRFEERLIGGVKTRIGVAESLIKEMGMKSIEYVTVDGDLIETVIGGFFTLRKEPERVAKDVKLAFDIMRAGITPVKAKIGDPRRVTFLKLRISGVKKKDILIDDARQSYDRGGDGGQGAHVVALNPATAPKQALALPMKDLDKGVAKFLKPTPMAQSDAPAIVAAAKKIVGNETDSFKAAAKINQWVFKKVKKKGLAALSNAAAVLKLMEGDCSEHTVLFVALCRAAGIPARQVTGIGYSAKMKGFGYHAWGEVYVGEWVQMDPSWGEDLVDPTHVKFGVGEAESLFAIGGLFGSLKIEVVEIKRK